MLCLIGLVGCRTTDEYTSDFDLLLKRVSYEVASSMPSKTLPTKRPKSAPEASQSVGEKVAQKTNTVRRGVRRVSRSVTNFCRSAMEKATLHLFEWGDDDDEYDPTPRGKADRNFKQWLDDRERWRKGE